MSTPNKARLQTQANRLKRLIAEGEAELEINRVKLARIEAQLGGPAAPATGLDLLWDAAPPKARERSSKQKCRIAFNKIPKAERPTVADMIAAIKLWARCDEWKKDAGQFVPGLHRSIDARFWECPPEDTAYASRARQAPPKPIAPVADAEKVTDKDEIRRFLGLRPLSAPAAAPKAEPAEEQTSLSD